jgi:endonuclease/exonuclease/phosphatase family metal-dependent hydrolase
MMVRLVTYNLCFGGADRLDALHRVLAHIAPDVAALTEADDPAVVAQLAERLGLQHVWARGSGDRHVALLSRFPIQAWAVYNRAPLTQAALEATLAVNTAGAVLTVYTVHLLPYLLLPFEVRRLQALRRLLAHAALAPGPRLILGDLNAIAPGDRVLQARNPARMQRVQHLQANLVFHLALSQLLRAGYVDCYRACHPNGSRHGPEPDVVDGFTWHTANPTTRYDYVFAEAGLAPRLRTCRVVDARSVPEVAAASDHFPLVAEFDLDA